MKTKFIITKHIPGYYLTNKKKVHAIIYDEVMGEVITINKIKVGVRIVNSDDSMIIFCHDGNPFWQVTDMETGGLITRYSKTKKEAIADATAKIKDGRYAKAIVGARKELKRDGIKLPVNA
jgi:hypothetical protein